MSQVSEKNRFVNLPSYDAGSENSIKVIDYAAQTDWVCDGVSGKEKALAQRHALWWIKRNRAERNSHDTAEVSLFGGRSDQNGNSSSVSSMSSVSFVSQGSSAYRCEDSLVRKESSVYVGSSMSVGLSFLPSIFFMLFMYPL